MALLPKKTYSRNNNDLTVLSDREKENVDPFDELLSSPLKQDVQFQPLSFWGKKIRRLDSKEKSKRADVGLFKGSDSDESISPCQRKRKPRAGKARTLQPKSRSRKFCDRIRNYSTADSHTKRTKACSTAVMANKNETVMSTKKIWKSEGRSQDSTFYTNESVEETLIFPPKSYDSCKFTNTNTHFLEADSNNNSYSVSSTLNYIKNLNESHCFNKPKSLNFKIYEDISTSKQQLANSDDALMYDSKEDIIDGTILFDKSMDETLGLCQLDYDSFKFVSKRRHFNYPVYTSRNDGSFLESMELKCAQFCSEPKKGVSNFKDVSMPVGFDSETLIFHEKSLASSSDGMDKTLCNEDSSDLNEKSKKISMLSYQSQSCISDGFLSDVSTPTKFNNETVVDYNDIFLNATSTGSEGLDKTLYPENCSPGLSGESKEMSVVENTIYDLISFNDTELINIIQELLNVNEMDGVLLETSSNSDDTLSSFMDEETVINVGLKAKKSDSPVTDSGTTKDVSHSISNGVADLTDSMSDLNIKNATGNGSPEPQNEKVDVPQDSNYEDKEKSSFVMGLRNVTTKRRGVLRKTYERKVRDRPSRATPQEVQKEDDEKDFNQSLWTMGRASMDWNKSISFVNPVFESTRVFDAGRKRQTNRFENRESIIEGTGPGFDRTYALKPGKKWLRSRSVLKQLENGTINGGRLESTRITGRKFESFVQEMLEIQNERSGFFNSVGDITVSNNTVIGGNVQNTCIPSLNASKTVSGCRSLPEKSNVSAFSNGTLPEKSSLNHTVKVIQEEEKPSAFRSALGLDNNNSVLKEDSALQESSSISARDFILMHCGQEDVLPFEEHFNERTLGNCRKIGEGVYGEVFMCSDTVIKIIPIEGADKVNGEPQKTFAEIISEVVIASKLSNLRKGNKHRTDGFSEMKRCWCVKGKYPQYLLKLWKEYDEQGSGSENDSPVMFKDDQLYIILELANGGKDLESFVFTSSAQSLSIFIQTAFSLAVAEKSFEFEHRDLHWGNVLISETKDKFMSVLLGGVEYKIPTRGVKVCIIDFTLSRISHDGCCIFNDLSVDPSLFTSEGDYQFEIYRLMLKEVKNDWSLFRPRTNLFWLHYILDKMLKMVRYKNKKAKLHIKHLKDLKSLESVVLEYKDSTDFVMGKPLNNVINKL